MNTKGLDDAVDSMLEMFIFETNQNLEQLEQITIQSEKNGAFSGEEINDIFRIMHTIKGSSAMMEALEVTALAHAVEDIFFYVREKKPEKLDCSILTDLVLNAADFIKTEIDKMEAGEKTDAIAADLIESTSAFLLQLKQINGEQPVKITLPVKPKPIQASTQKLSAYIDLDEPVNVFQAKITYKDHCEMENIRAYTLINNVKGIVGELHYLPDNILEDDESANIIRKNGFNICFTTSKEYDEINVLLNRTIFLKELELEQLTDVTECSYWPKKEMLPKKVLPEKSIAKVEEREVSHPSMISVNVTKLDILMDLVGELVISEAMVTENPDLQGLDLDNFYKAARQLKKISNELQDGVMSIRMVPLSGTFQKMNRIVRDMSKKLNKQAELVLIGEETEVDKNVIEHISDPLMHLIRNSLDHGIELPEEREKAGKNPVGKITLEANNAGNEVIINIVDDGQGLNKEKILKKARENQLLYKNESDFTDKEIYSFIFSPGLSTNEKVTEFSGRGVGMDVVMKNINAVGGNIIVNSEPGKGSMITLKIPLTLAIITGMTIKVGQSRYTIPIMSIRESFKPSLDNILVDPNGNEMIMVRGKCYSIVRLHQLYHIAGAATDFDDGVMIMVETEKTTIGLFADQLIGQQQIVVKPIPAYIKNISKTQGITGCTLLGDGSISLILDAVGIANRV
ncbi:chemotaxis protein CheA [Propionispira raffinosivorans]|uniref:chemotaxis protein CheA n=1 Tax=Propionispira raffinosivorans TaxID=86959 RepID=UPI000375CD4F|nr:chemotaxis protein CheA [Propionispira raffinosivorans]